MGGPTSRLGPPSCERQGRMRVRKERSGGRKAIAGVAGAAGHRRAGCDRRCSRPPREGPTAATPSARSSTTPATSSPGRTSRSAASKSAPSNRSSRRPTAKAAVVLSIANPGFQNFRRDASCTIRPLGLIGEKYVDCDPDPAAGRRHAAAAPAEARSPAATKAPASTTCRSPTPTARSTTTCSATSTGCPNASASRSSSTNSAPGCSGRGSDLKAVIRRANPALQELDKVLHDPRQREHTCWRNWPSTPTRR